MKNLDFGLMIATGVIVTLAVLAVIFANFRVAQFTTKTSIEDIRQLLSQNNVGICSEKNFVLDTLPGFMEGRSLTLSLNCLTDPDEMTVSIITFDSEAAREAALRNANSVHRNGFGPHFVYIYGPNLITVEGYRDLATQMVLGKILTNAGATP